MCKLIKIFFVWLAVMAVCICGEEKVYARENDNTKTASEDIYDLSEYDFSKIDSVLEKNDVNDYFGSFEKLVTNLAYGNNDSDGIFESIKNTFYDEFINNADLLVQIILLAILSAALKAFVPAFNKNQVSDIAHIVIQIMLITLLMASFINSCNIAFGTIQDIVDIYKAIVPCFCSAVLVVSGSLTSAAYYQVILIMITFVSSVMKNVMIAMAKMYFLLICADSVSDKEQFEKARELIGAVIKWTCRIAVVIFSGVAGIKGLTNPVNDSVRKNVLYKTVKLVPGVGDVIEGVAGVVAGAGMVVKNSIGAAAIIVLLIMCAVPLIKLIAFTLMFKLAAAAIEPIADKRLVKAVNGASKSIGYLIIIVMVAVSLFMVMLAIICISTNYNYALS